MFGNCWSWPPVKVSRFRPFLSYMENPWAPSHISKCEVGIGGSIALFLRGAMMHSMTMGQIYGSVPARRGFEAANAAHNVFNSLSTGVNVCVLSNGVLLERQ